MCPRDGDAQRQNGGTTTTTAATAPAATAAAADVDDGGGSSAATALRATADMCRHCFDVVIDELSGVDRRPPRRRGGRHQRRRRAGDYDDGDGDPDGGGGGGGGGGGMPPPYRSDALPPTAECPLFVTWDKLRPHHRRRRLRPSSPPPPPQPGGGDATTSTSPPPSPPPSPRDYDLRGCIGTLSPRPVHSALGEYALASAFRDRRFDPVTRGEVPHLRVAVSLLVDYEECRDALDWIVGVHGLVVRFEAEGGVPYSATYLPEVPLEQGWTQEEAVRSLMRKSGYRGELTDALLARVRCTRYRSSKRRLSYDEYATLKGGDPLAAGGGDEFDDGGGSKSPRPPPPPPPPPPSSKRGGWRTPCFNLPFSL